MSLREMQSQLSAAGVKLDLDYINKLRNSVAEEQSRRNDRRTLSRALAVVEDTLTETTRMAWQIALNPAARHGDRIAAMREIRKSHATMFQILFDAGIFERKLGTLEHEIRRAPLSEEQKKNISEAFQKWGLIATEKNKEKSGAEN